MARTLAGCALLIALPAVSFAQQSATTGETVIKFVLSPMPAPRPALKYQLLPDLAETNPGNPVHGYLLCFMEQQHFFFDREQESYREKWLNAPLADLPAVELRGYGGAALRKADDAARLDTADWQVLPTLKRDGINTLLPDVQQMRKIAAAMKLRFRGEVADGRYDDAIRSAKTMFALSRHLGEHPTFIGELVGMAVALIAMGPLEEMIGQPGCPNLYWALATLPTPLVDIRKGLLGDRLWAVQELALLTDTAPMSESDVRKTVEKIVEMAKTFDAAKRSPGPRAWLEGKAKDEAYLAAARKRLVEIGIREELVKKFSPMQVVLLDEKREYEEVRDSRMKALLLPYWQTATVPELPLRPNASLLSELVSAGRKIRTAQGRIEQRLALLRHVEAIRMYLTESGGKLPEKLSDLRVPLPTDPFSGQPMNYKLTGDTAELWGAPPGADTAPATKIRYELTVRK